MRVCFVLERQVTETAATKIAVALCEWILDRMSKIFHEVATPFLSILNVDWENDGILAQAGGMVPACATRGPQGARCEPTP